MRIWLVTVGEPLPIDGTGDPPLRAGLLAEQLARSGHHVVWWTSTFNHAHKQQRVDRDTVVHLNDRYCIRMLHGRAYRSPVSILRVLNHLDVAGRFRQQVAGEPQSDMILCSWPTVELRLEATRYGQERNVPNKPVEYLSAGLPIVSSLQGVLADLLVEHKCGITYPNHDAVGLATAVTGLRDDADRLRQMSGNVLKLYRKQFVAEKVYAEMQTYLEQIADCTLLVRAA